MRSPLGHEGQLRLDRQDCPGGDCTGALHGESLPCKAPLIHLPIMVFKCVGSPQDSVGGRLSRCSVIAWKCIGVFLCACTALLKLEWQHLPSQ